MPGAVRPNKAAMKIAYKILKTPNDMRQDKQRRPSPRMIREMFIDSSAAQ
jgi:hypothetical protein